MPTLIKYCTQICEIDRASPDQSSSSSCDVGKYSATTNNCFFNFESINTLIPAGATVTGASLSLLQIAGGFSTALTSKVTLRQGNWGAFTWNSGPLLAAAGIQFILSGSSQTTRSVDVTDIVQWIVSNNSPHHIFRLERVPNDQSGTTDAKRFSPTPSNHSLQITYTAPTACTEPASFSLTPPVAETTATLSWSGASGGTGNAITGYDLESSESTDGSVWGAWESLGLIASSSSGGSVVTAPPSVRGNYLRFQIQVQGAAGSAYYSPWKVTSNTVRRNVLAAPPTAFTASPAVYVTPSVVLAWSGTVPGTSAIKNYVIQQSTSADGSSWSTWETVTTVTSSATSGTYTATPSNTPGMYTRYRIAVTDTLNAVSAYAVSNTVRKSANPAVPAVAAPKNSSSTYDANPLCLIQVGAHGSPQTLYVYSTAGVWLNSVDNLEHFSRGGTFIDGERTVFQDSDTAPGTYTVRIEARDAYASSTTVSRTITVMPSPFEEILPDVTHVKASHITALRTAIDRVRNYYSLAPVAWSYEIVPGRTNAALWVYHITEIREALQPVADIINAYAGDSEEVRIAPFEWLPLGVGRPRADVMNQLYALILSL